MTIYNNLVNIQSCPVFFTQNSEGLKCKCIDLIQEYISGILVDEAYQNTNGPISGKS